MLAQKSNNQNYSEKHRKGRIWIKGKKFSEKKTKAISMSDLMNVWPVFFLILLSFSTKSISWNCSCLLTASSSNEVNIGKLSAKMKETRLWKRSRIYWVTNRVRAYYIVHMYILHRVLGVNRTHSHLHGIISHPYVYCYCLRSNKLMLSC